MNPPDQFDTLIKRPKAWKQMGMSETTAWRRARDDPDFPQAIQTGPSSFCYRVSDVQRWIETRPVRRLPRAIAEGKPVEASNAKAGSS